MLLRMSYEGYPCKLKKFDKLKYRQVWVRNKDLWLKHRTFSTENFDVVTGSFIDLKETSSDKKADSK